MYKIANNEAKIEYCKDKIKDFRGNVITSISCGLIWLLPILVWSKRMIDDYGTLIALKPELLLIALFIANLAVRFVAASIESKKLKREKKRLLFFENEEELNKKLEEKQNSKNPIVINEAFTETLNERKEENRPMIDVDNYDLLTLREMKKILEGEEAPVLENNKTLGQKTYSEGKQY